jgi:molybdate transport system regulatory protein
MNMKSSARNQWHGTVSRIELGAVNAEIEVALKGGTPLVAQVTKESALALKLEVGREVIALVKAPQITLVTDYEGYRFSTRNQLNGTISKVSKGPVTTEVEITLSTGDAVVASVTTESANTLGLAVGGNTAAVFKAAAVVLAAAI